MANKVHAVVVRQFSARNGDVMNAQCPHKCCPPLCLLCPARARLFLLLLGWGWFDGSIGTAELLSVHFNSKPSWDPGKSVIHSPICLPVSTNLCLWSREVRRLLLALHSYGGTDQFGMFLFFSEAAN